MSKKKKYIPLIILFTFSIYCALAIGQSLDEAYHLMQGKITFDYLISLGNFDIQEARPSDRIEYGKFYSTIYWSFLYFITELFPSRYETEVMHLLNLVFSFSAIVGFAKVCEQLFNKKTGRIAFVILFFYPAFFGHMSINSKDTILAACHVWIFYLILRYLKNQKIKEKKNNYIISLGLLAAVSTGIQLTFLGSLIPIFLFLIFEIFLFKKIITKSFNTKLFLYDIIKCFLVFYSVLILFWIDVHQNILVLPFYLIQDLLSDYITGWPYNLVNGIYYRSVDVPPYYFILNFVYKSPEYILLAYVVFVFLIIQKKDFFKMKFTFFYYKLCIIVFLLIFPNLIIFFIPFPINDGMRLFLWIIPYYCIIPALVIHYIIENLHIKKIKVASIVLSLIFAYHLFNFLSITPYQYTYLNLLNGKTETRYKKFENDYWATSLKELIRNTNFNTDKKIKFSTCGFIDEAPKHYLKKKTNLNYVFVKPNEAEYIIMTNRVSRYHGIVNCFDIFEGKEVSSVKRNGAILSTIRKMK